MSKRELSEPEPNPGPKKEKLEAPVEKKVGRNLFETVHDGLPAMKKRNVPKSMELFYHHWQKTAALPRVYEIERDNEEDDDENKTIDIIMERAGPFVYDESKLQDYHQSAAEVWRLSGNNKLNICPDNIKMRDDGQIVFVGVFTGESYPFYQEGNSLDAVKISLDRSLFEIKHKAAILAKFKEWLAEIKSILPDAKAMHNFTGLTYPIFDHKDEDDAEIGLCALIRCFGVLKRARMVYLGFWSIGKNMEDYKIEKRKSNMPDVDDYIDNYVKNIKIHVFEVIREFGGTAEEIELFKERNEK